MNIKYVAAAAFDDQLELTTRVVRSRGVRIEHDYRIVRCESETKELIVEAHSVIACVDRDGKVARLPAYLRQA
jgi:acyl-CoA thioester hydrolase